MTIYELTELEEKLNEELFLYQYKKISPVVEEILIEYFESGGTVEEFNDKLNFGISQQKVLILVSNLYKEWRHNIG